MLGCRNGGYGIREPVFSQVLGPKESATSAYGSYQIVLVFCNQQTRNQSAIAVFLLRHAC